MGEEAKEAAGALKEEAKAEAPEAPKENAKVEAAEALKEEAKEAIAAPKEEGKAEPKKNKKVDAGIKAMQLTEEQQKSVQTTFRAIDKDGSGTIEAKELKVAMQALGKNMSDDEVSAILADLDIDHNGKVEEVEYMQMVSDSVQHLDSKNQTEPAMKRPAILPDEQVELTAEQDASVRNAFRAMDLDGSGYIDAKELKIAMQAIGTELSDEDVLAVLKSLDLNQNGKVEEAEYLRMVSHTNKTHKAAVAEG